MCGPFISFDRLPLPIAIGFIAGWICLQNLRYLGVLENALDEHKPRESIPSSIHGKTGSRLGKYQLKVKEGKRNLMDRKTFLNLAAGAFLYGRMITGYIPKEPTKGGEVTVSPNRTLNWEDFRKVDVIRGTSSINAICLSTCEVEINKVTAFSDHVKLEIDAQIEHQKELSQVTVSFLSRGDDTKKEVLHHENGHFIIAQIIGYRIVKDANAYRFHPKNYKSQLNAIIRENFKDWKRLDSQYDAHTTKPNNPEMQRKWDRFFAEELEALKREILK